MHRHTRDVWADKGQQLMHLLPATAEQAAHKIASWLPEVMECPPDVGLIQKALEGADNHLICDGEEVVGWLALASNHDGDKTLDIAIRSSRQRKWLTRGVLREAAEVLFKDRDFVLLENSKGPALKLALRLGANPIHIVGKKDTYVLSALSFKEKFH